MANGLDLFATQNRILDWLKPRLEAAGYDAYEGDIADAIDRAMVNGVAQTTCVIQFGDLLPLANDKSFCGPELDGYYSLFRVFSLASTADRARQANSVVNQLVLGLTLSNVGAIRKEGGGGAYALGEANTRPIAYGLISSYRYSTNMLNPGEKISLPVYPPVPTP